MHTCKAQVGESWAKAGPRQKNEALSEKQPKAKRSGGMSQRVEFKPKYCQKEEEKKKRVNIQTQAAAVLSIPCCPLCRGEKQSQNHLQLCSQFRTQVSPSPEGLLSGSLCKVLRVP
jgi:hypothetical protein